MNTIFKRRAILIGASPKNDPLENVAFDIKTWKDFLESKYGGGWNEYSEIFDSSELSKKELLGLIQASNNFDYTMIIFAGHGFTVKTDLPWPELNLLLQTGENILERELNPGSQRCCLVLDCCRAHGENVQPLQEQVKESSLSERSEEILARKNFENALAKSELGLVKIYATGDNAAAADKFSFSQILIHTARNLASKNRGILYMNDAVSNAASLVKTIHPQQNPEYHGGRRLNHFPFALGL
jgi:hypothetical protein